MTAGVPHRTPAALAQVAVGGAFGAAAREAVEQALPTAAHHFPAATLSINLSGAFALGLLLEVLARSGDDSGGRRRARLVVGTGFLGAFTTYSTFAVDTDLLVRAGRPGSAAVYVAVTVAAGLAASGAGIVVGGVRARRHGLLPVDPDVDSDGTGGGG